MVIVSTNPQDGQTGIGLLSTISITFDKPVDASSLTGSSIVVVSTKKDTLMVDTAGIPVASEALLTDNLFTDTFDKAVVGDISVDPNDPNTILFVPKINYNKSTGYKVIVSNTIAATDGELLSNIYAFTFTTTSEEQVLQTPVQESVTVLDNKYILATDEGAPTAREFYIVDSEPVNESVGVATTTWVIIFNDNIDPNTVANNVLVRSSEILKDGQTPLNFTASVSDRTLTIDADITDENFRNLLIEITLLPAIASTNGDQLGEIQRIYFLSQMSPYYGSITLMRFLAGTLISNIKDITLATGLYYYSQLAQRVFAGMASHYMNELLDRYAVVYTLYTLITNNFAEIANGSKITKTLGDFTITVDNGVQAQISNRILADLKKEIDGLNLYAALVKTGSFVKGINSADYPTDIGRLWDVPNDHNEPPGYVKRRRPGSLRGRW